MSEASWPHWWDWEIEFIDHAYDSMADRHVTEAEVRQMLEEAAQLRRDHESGRWAVFTRWQSRPWKIIVEPEADEQKLLVITAHMIE